MSTQTIAHRFTVEMGWSQYAAKKVEVIMPTADGTGLVGTATLAWRERYPQEYSGELELRSVKYEGAVRLDARLG